MFSFQIQNAADGDASSAASVRVFVDESVAGGVRVCVLRGPVECLRRGTRTLHVPMRPPVRSVVVVLRSCPLPLSDAACDTRARRIAGPAHRSRWPLTSCATPSAR